MSSHPRQPGSSTSSTSNTRSAPATSGSQTITQPSAPTLRLRAQSPSTHQQPRSQQTERRHIQWDDSVVDNEGMGKKSSKVCCIYHAPHEPGDSSSDSSSSSDDSDSEGGEDLSRAWRAGGPGQRAKGKKKNGGEGDGGGDEGEGKQRKASPNAYERQPKAKAKSMGRTES